MADKKLAIVAILKILEKKSDENHPIRQKDMCTILEKDYDILLERKAIRSNIDRLIEIGYDIEKTERGYYLSGRLFEDAELHLLIDSVLASKYISMNNTTKLIDKIISLSSDQFKEQVKRVQLANEWDKSENKQLFYNIDEVARAIEMNRQIEFDYYKYQTDKQLHKSSHKIVSPYQLIIHNQRYYLMSHDDENKWMAYYRLDRIKDIQINENVVATDIHTIPGYARGIDFRKFSRALPYMYADDPQTIIFKAEEWIIDQIIDWFGRDVGIVSIPGDDKNVKVTVEVSPNAMEYWVLQYSKSVEVLYPEDFRQRIIEDIKAISEKYKI